MIDPHFEALMAERPSIIRNGLFIYLVFIISRVLSFVFVVAGLVYLIDYFFGLNWFIEYVLTAAEPSEEKEKLRLKLIFGTVAISLGLLMSFISFTCRIIFTRNIFISDIETWYKQKVEKFAKEERA